VVVHNFRAGVMEKLGLGYAQLAAAHPRLVYASSGGWGDHGPSADRARGGHDLMARAEAGWFTQPDPAKSPFPAGMSADYPAGLMLMPGILIALLARARTGFQATAPTDGVVKKLPKVTSVIGQAIYGLLNRCPHRASSCSGISRPAHAARWPRIAVLRRAP
jgi:crotonobetainyl-CoA:carnitine CoA-transferase CaiB-like acyl-CoA transferase